MDVETWCRAMDANPACGVTMAAFADWLQEQGDDRWEGIAVLAEHGKTGLVPAFVPYTYTGATPGSGWWTPAYVGCRESPGGDENPPHAVIDAEWYERSLSRRDGCKSQHRSLAAARVSLAGQWAAAGPFVRRRWLANTGRAPRRRPPDVAKSRRWLQNYADRMDLSLPELLLAADRYQEDGEHLVQYDSEEWRNMWDGYGGDAFWSHWATVTGKPIRQSGNMFSCSC